jgi:putative ATPase
MKELGYSDNYKYAHDFPDNFVEQEFLPENIESIKFYEPGNNKHEIEIRKRLSVQWKKYNY